MQNSVTKNNDILKICDLDKPNDFMIGSHYFMIASAIYMGFKEIYLLGVGYTYQPIQRCHFYDSSSEIENAKKIENALVDSRNIDIINVAENRGVKIYNVVPDGYESPMYNKINLSDLYKIVE